MTELIWEGKYDAQGRKVAPPRIVLPFQTVETVNESAADRERNLSLFGTGGTTEWRNRLIWGDKKYVLPSLLEEFAGKVDLIYIDPPFDTGANFTYVASIPDDPDTEGDQAGTFVKQPTVIEQKAYRDTWGRGLDGYLQWFFDTALLLRELMSDRGGMYVHLDYHVAHAAKLVLDEVFGFANFVSEIIWKRTSAHSSADRHGPIHDTILYYCRSEQRVWNPMFQPFDPEYIETFYEQKDRDGRRWKRDDLTGSGVRRGPTGETWRGIDVTAKGRHWRVPPEELDAWDAAGRIHWPAKEGGMPRLKLYADEQPGLPLQDLWVDIAPLHNLSGERASYPTQKPESLLERIVKVSSNEGDLVLDCFCGSGTTAAVAEKLNRRWITCDLGRFAIHTTRKRLLAIPGVKPFVVQNLGKYERQAWQSAEFGEGADRAVESYRRFVLDLYHAEPVSGYVWLHGNRSGRMIHVGGVDAPVTRADITAIVTEFRKATGSGKNAPKRSGVDVLGWDFAFELNQVAKQDAEKAGIDLKLVRIPREVLEKKAVEQGDIKFFELAALGVDVKARGKTVTLKLTDFIIAPDDVPEEVRKAVSHWEQWIDYWAVDWDNSGDTFHNEWQSYRTRKDKTIERQVSHTYPEPGEYQVVVKVIDILGNDTTRLLHVEAK